jgi:hypothetical protein
MIPPVPHPTAIVAVTSDAPKSNAVLKRAASVARSAGSAVILWDRDAAVSPLESPLPTDWSGEGEEQQFGDRLGPNDLIAAGREPLARQVGELRQEGIDAWGWLPEAVDAEHLADYATDQKAELVFISAEDNDLLEDLRDLSRDDEQGRRRHLRIEAVPD